MIPRGVLFDLDGTLGDHDSSVAAALAAWLPELGVTPHRRAPRRRRTVVDVDDRLVAAYSSMPGAKILGPGIVPRRRVRTVGNNAWQ